LLFILCVTVVRRAVEENQPISVQFERRLRLARLVDIGIRAQPAAFNHDPAALLQVLGSQFGAAVPGTDAVPGGCFDIAFLAIDRDTEIRHVLPVFGGVGGWVAAQVPDDDDTFVSYVFAPGARAPDLCSSTLCRS